MKMVRFYSEFNPLMFGLSLGFVGAALSLIVSLLSLVTKTYAFDTIYVLKSIFPYYSISATGILLGAAYSFASCFLLGFVFALLYNRLVR